MDLARPESALLLPGALDALMHLARAGGPVRNPDTAWADTLAALTALGVVRHAGGGHELNREHVLVMAVEQLAAARGRVNERLRMHIALWDPAPASAMVTGSAARGDGGPDADIDIVLVRDAAAAADARWRAQVAALRADVAAWSGNPAHIIEVERLADGPPPHAVMLT